VNDGVAALPDPAHLASGYMVGGKYEIKRLLGEGANGSVYEGEHTEIGHRVAIKVVHKDLALRDDIIARFRREARICGTIRNRHVGQVYDVGELPGGAPYMVMELQEGGSLADMLAGAPIAIGVAVEICRQLLVGVQAAHDIGVIHRDIKPPNVMLVRESGQLLVKLVDFGIGKNITPDLRARGVTLEGMVVGSPDYMAPEQLRGEPVDPRADLYGVGVVLYESVTGRVPFDADSLTELFVAVLRDPIVPPRTLRPECPVLLEHVIMKALSRAAAQRYASAAEMEKALLEVQRTCALDSTAPPGRADRGARNSSRSQLRRVPTTAAGRAIERVKTTTLAIPLKRTGRRAALLALLALVLAGLWLMRSPASEWTEARAAERAARDRSAAPHLATPAPLADEKAAAERSAQTLAAQAGAGAPTSPVDLMPTGPASRIAPPAAKLRSKQAPGAVQAAVEVGERAGSKAEDAPAVVPVAQPAGASAGASRLTRDAFSAYVRGQMPRARALYREATLRSPSHADAWRGLGMVSSRLGDRNEARRAFERYLALRPQAGDAAAIAKKLAELRSAR
jgi:eukaryotic-like serine/threonine-protein kinase